MEMTKSNNCSLREIAALLFNANSVLIFPHIQMDGDTLGASAALCEALRQHGKKVDILIEDKIPKNLEFLDKGYCTWVYDGEEKDVCIALDCSDRHRIEKRYDAFKKGRHTALIDHHVTTDPFAEFNYVDSKVSSTGEIVFHLLKEMDQKIDAVIAEALYAAIATDTGNFVYSNTSRETHLVVAELYKTSMDHTKVAVEIYQRKRLEKVKLQCAILSTMQLIHDGKGCLAVMTQQMLEDTGAYPEETEGMVEELRNIEGVEISVLLKEEQGTIKVSMRAKTKANVSEIAERFGGGGHTKAAGCTIAGDIDGVRLLIIEAINQHLDNLESN